MDRTMKAAVVRALQPLAIEEVPVPRFDRMRKGVVEGRIVLDMAA